MTVTEAKRLPPGMYEFTFTDGRTDLGVIGNDRDGPWYAHVNGGGAYDGAKNWKLVRSIHSIISSNPRLPS